ncbi:MAG: hypothetical protein AB9836_04345 [Aminipila sp.]
MILTQRDYEIIDSLNIVGGGTIEFISQLHFKSYNRASRRLKQLKDYGFLKSEVHPIIGKLVYYKEKCPSYHSLIANEIFLQFKDQIKETRKNAPLGNCEVDFVIKLKDSSLLLFEIELENRVTEDKIKRIKENMERPYELYIITNRQSDRKKQRINLRELWRIEEYRKNIR